MYSDDSGSGKTYHDLLLRDDIHAVIIAVTILNGPEFIEAALLAGKHVLSEKPIAPDIKGAQKLISFYNEKIDRTKTTWAVAENFRFLESFAFGASEVAKLGRLLGFRAKMFTKTEPGGKFFGKPPLTLIRIVVISNRAQKRHGEKSQSIREVSFWTAVCISLRPFASFLDLPTLR